MTTIEDRLLNGALAWAGSELPKINIAKRENNFEVVVSVPGYQAEQLSTQWENGVLQIEGKVDSREITEDRVYLRRDIRIKPFNYRIQLPDSAQENGIAAELKHGLLTVTVPLKPKKSIPIEINIGSSTMNQGQLLD